MLHSRQFNPASEICVTFLHPGNATGEGWADIIERLPDIHAVTVDLPGYGSSRDVPLTSFEDAADHVAETLSEALAGKKTHVVGLSLGGYIGFRLASRHADRVHSALLSGFQVEPLSGAAWMIPLGDAISGLMTWRWPRRMAFWAMDVPPGSSWWPTAQAPSSAATLRQLSRAAAAFDARPDLETVEPPILALAGQKEFPSIRRAVSEIAQHVPRGVGRFAPGGHAWLCSNPDLFLATLRAWLAGGELPEALSHPDTEHGAAS